jgi:hypothetical protein
MLSRRSRRPGTSQRSSHGALGDAPLARLSAAWERIAEILIKPCKREKENWASRNECIRECAICLWCRPACRPTQCCPQWCSNGYHLTINMRIFTNILFIPLFIVWSICFHKWYWNCPLLGMFEIIRQFADYITQE